MLNVPLTELSASLAGGKVSSVELTQLFLDRIAKLDGGLNAFITVDPARALGEARAADARRAAGDTGPLLGIPVAHKDIFCTQGMATTCGSKMLANFVAPYDAHVVEQFAKAGAVLLGKTNMDEFAMGSSNESSFFGPVRNPWRTSAVPGGSSGGSAAAVAARMAPVATGTDTGGSIRQPASLTGISGLKPTYGLVSRYGMIAFASSLDQGGPMGKTAADLAILLNAMTGFDARDSTSLERPKEDYARDLEAPLAGMRIGLPKEYFGDGVDADVAARVREAIRWYEGQGAKVVEITLPNTHLAVPVYYVLAPAEASSNLSRFDGVRYGHRTAEYADAYYLQAQKIRRLIARGFTDAFTQCDLIMGPVAPSTAFEIGALSSDPVQMYLNDIFTIPASLAGLPGMSIPCGFDGRGLPVGLQVIGNYFSEARMLNAAHQYQKATDWHLRVPAGTPL